MLVQSQLKRSRRASSHARQTIGTGEREAQNVAGNGREAREGFGGSAESWLCNRRSTILLMSVPTS